MSSSIRSSVGSEPPVVMRLPSMTKPLAHHRHLRIGAGEILEVFPVGRGGEIVEQTRFGKQPGTGFNPRHQLPIPRRLRQQHLELRGGAALPVVARQHEERRRLALRPEGTGHRNRDAAFRLDRRTVRTEHRPGVKRPPGNAVGGAHWLDDGGNEDEIGLRQDQQIDMLRLRNAGLHGKLPILVSDNV
ncbi:hypothetical protein ABIA23_002032 [Sinorhizobium fredii]